MDSIIRTGLRKVMRKMVRKATVRNQSFDQFYNKLGDQISDQSDDQISDQFYDQLYDQIMKTYAEGYISGGDMIRRHAPRGVLLTAAAPLPVEDPRIAKATTSVIYGLYDSIGNHKNEIQAKLRHGYEQGYSIPKLSERIGQYFDNNRATSTRFARTITNDVYNRAHLDRYEDSGIVEGVQYSAHIDDRTSDICQMLNGTIYAIGDQDIQVPPLHFNCRSRLVPYFNKIPDKRDFNKQFGSEFVKNAEKTSSVFRSKYWAPMPYSKASSPYQRSYFLKSDIKIINKGISQVIKEYRTKKIAPDILPLERLKKMLRYRKIDPNKSVIIDRYGKSLMLDKFEEHDIIRAIKSLITQADARIAREIARRKKEISVAWKDVLATRRDLAANAKDIAYYKKRMATDPTQAVEYRKIIDRDIKRTSALKASEERRIREWQRIVDLDPSANTIKFEMEKERYQDMLDGFNFQKR